jgi:predicted DNA-binding protein (MmcQ/YjbR family)
MTADTLGAYCLSKKGAHKSYPFDATSAVYKVGEKMFALIAEPEMPPRITLKCDPIYALELRSLYASVTGGYYMNKKHWNTITCDGEVDESTLREWIDHSYALVVSALPKKVQNAL